MISKIILGIIMGIFAASAANTINAIKDNPALQPAGNSEWFYLSGTLAQLVVLVWVIATFVQYSVGYGVLAIVEVIVGAIASGALSFKTRYQMTALALPAVIISWAIL